MSSSGSAYDKYKCRHLDQPGINTNVVIRNNQLYLYSKYIWQDVGLEPPKLGPLLIYCKAANK